MRTPHTAAKKEHGRIARPPSAHQRTPQRAAGAAWKYAIDIANLAGKDMWLYIPVVGTEEYIRQFTRFIKERQDPESNVYIETGSEVWDYGITQFIHKKMAAVDEVAKSESYANSFPTSGCSKEEVWARRRQARRLHNTIRIHSGVFGADQIKTHIRGVQTGWTITPSEYSTVREWMKTRFGEPYNLLGSSERPIMLTRMPPRRR